MAFDEELASRIRDAIDDVPAVTEIKMFGGLCWTVNGNMAVGVNGNDLMVRMARRRRRRRAHGIRRPADGPHGATDEGLRIGRPRGHRRAADLGRWVDRGVAFASSLPPKVKRSKAKAKAKAKARKAT